MSKSKISVIEALTSNKKIKMGVLFFLIAIILVFASIYVHSGSLSGEGCLYSDKSVRIKETESLVEGSLYLSYDASSKDLDPIKVNVLDKNKEILNSTELKPRENKEVNLSPDAVFLRKMGGSDNISYSYFRYYSHQPYWYLSIPGLILTILGIISVYKGFNQYMGALKNEEKRQKYENNGEKGEDIDFMGIERKREENEGEKEG